MDEQLRTNAIAKLAGRALAVARGWSFLGELSFMMSFAGSVK